MKIFGFSGYVFTLGRIHGSISLAFTNTTILGQMVLGVE